jgi:hypothetical protein
MALVAIKKFNKLNVNSVHLKACEIQSGLIPYKLHYNNILESICHHSMDISYEST